MPGSNPSFLMLRSKVVGVNRNLPDASGDVAYVGCGFKPTCLIYMGGVLTLDDASWGMVDEGNVNGSVMEYGKLFTQGPSFIYAGQGPGDNQKAVVKSFDADGFTLTWTKTGNPLGQIQGTALAMR